MISSDEVQVEFKEAFVRQRHPDPDSIYQSLGHIDWDRAKAIAAGSKMVQEKTLDEFLHQGSEH